MPKLLRVGDNSYVLIQFVSPSEWKDGGYGEYVSSADPPTIKISEDIRGLSLLDTLVHESLHHLMPFLSEETVTEQGTALARMLWRCGYRTNEDWLMS